MTSRKIRLFQLRFLLLNNKYRRFKFFSNNCIWNTSVYIYIYVYISGWIFQKVLAEIVQKDLILSQKALISNRRNLGLFALTSMRFPSKDSKSKDLSF